MSSYEQDQYDDEIVYIDGEPVATCKFCGLLVPKCDCELSAEAKVNQLYPWPTDPAALTASEATTLTAARFDFRRGIIECDECGWAFDADSDELTTIGGHNESKVICEACYHNNHTV